MVMISMVSMQIAFSKVADKLENHNDQQDDYVIGTIWILTFCFSYDFLDDVKILSVGYGIDDNRELNLDNLRSPQVTDESSSLGLV